MTPVGCLAQEIVWQSLVNFKFVRRPVQVEEITLNATIVRCSDGGRMWYSNTKLAASNLINLSRSDNRHESFKVSKHVLARRCMPDREDSWLPLL